VLRELARVLADHMNQRVMIVDTSNEIAGEGSIAHHSIGKARRIQVSDPTKQHVVLLEAVQNHTPQVIIVDEIGTSDEVKSIQAIAHRGIRMIATVHGQFLNDIIDNPSLNKLLGGIHSVILSAQEAIERKCNKSVLERQASPVFDCAIELSTRNSWLVYDNVTTAVDKLLEQRSWKDNYRINMQSKNLLFKAERRELITAMENSEQLMLKKSAAVPQDNS
jgi:stage III sporulation protein SpoIIIAA